MDLTQQQKKALSVLALFGGEVIAIHIAMHQFFGKEFGDLVANDYISCIPTEVDCISTYVYILTSRGWDAVAKHGHTAIDSSMSDRYVL